MRGGQNGKLLFSGYRVLVWEDKNVLKTGGDNGLTAM